MFTFCQEKNKVSVDQHCVNLFAMEFSLEDRERFREMLRLEMARRGIPTKRAFAKLLGVRPQYIGQILNGQAGGLRKLRDFAKRLRVSNDYLLGRENLPEAADQFYQLPAEEIYLEAQAPAPADLELIAACVEEMGRFKIKRSISSDLPLSRFKK